MPGTWSLEHGKVASRCSTVDFIFYGINSYDNN